MRGAKMHIAARAASPLRRRLPLRSLSPLVRRSARRASAALRARRLRSVGRSSSFVRRCSLARGAAPVGRSFVVVRSSVLAARYCFGAPIGPPPAARLPLSLPPLSLPPFAFRARLRAVLSLFLLSPSLPSPCVLAPPSPAASAPLSLRSLSTLQAAAPLRSRPGGKRIFAPRIALHRNVNPC